MFGKFVIWFGAAIICSAAIRFLLVLDLNKRVYNHYPGPCKYVAGPRNGAEDIELLPDGTAFITSGLLALNKLDYGHVTGKIFLYKFKSNITEHKAEELKIEGENFDPETFNPLGLSSHVSEEGRITLYVISLKRTGAAIELFRYSKTKKTLTHMKTITDSLIYAPNNLVVVGPNKFFVTNFNYFLNEYLKTIETFLLLNLGSLVYYDGEKGQIVDSWLPGPNGLALHPKKQYLYMSLLWEESIRIYKLSPDMKIEQHSEMNLLTGVDNLFVDRKTGDLWTATHMVMYQMMKHMMEPHKHTAPSQVLRIRLQEDQKSWGITEVYSNDGLMLSGSSVAVVYRNQLLIGTVHHRLMHCNITNMDYA